MLLLTGLNLPNLLAGASVISPLVTAWFAVPMGGTAPLIILAASI